MSSHENAGVSYVKGTIEFKFGFPILDTHIRVLRYEGTTNVVVEQVSLAHLLPGCRGEGVGVRLADTPVGDLASTPVGVGASKVWSRIALLLGDGSGQALVDLAR